MVLLAAAPLARPPAACAADAVTASPRAARGAARLEVLVPQAVMHGIEGINFDLDGTLLGTSIHGLSVYRIDVRSGRVTVAVGPPDGESDDVAVGPRGTAVEGWLAWTAQSSGEIRFRRPGGRPEVALREVPRVNPIAFSADGRLYTSQVGAGDDTLWELDLTGQRPPRRVLSGQGRLNGFAFGPDGVLYAPQFGTDRLVAIDVARGVQRTIASGTGAPAALRVAPNGDLWHVDYLTGDVWTTPAQSALVEGTPLVHGQPRIVTRVREPIDSIAIDRDGTLYVSNVADSSVVAIDPASGKSRDVVPAAFAMPLGLAFAPRDGVPTLLAADPFGWRWVDPKTGRIDRPHWAANRWASSAVAADERYVAYGFEGSGRVRVLDRRDDALVLDVKDLGAPRGLLLERDGAVLVADAAGGRLLRVTPAGVQVLASGLEEPVALAAGGRAGSSVLVAEARAGRVSRVALEGGARTDVVTGLRRPTALATLADGRIVVAEPDTGEVLAIEPRSSTRTLLARGLALSLEGLDLPRNTNGGLAVGPDGAIYVSCPGDNSIVRITPRGLGPRGGTSR